MTTDVSPSIRRARTMLLALVGDAVVVLVFAALGRGFHGEVNPLLGVLATAWPFLVGLLLVWATPLVRRQPMSVWPAGLVVWIATYALGMLLRGVTGQGLAAPFLVVALSVLGVAFLGWRLVALLIRRTARRPLRGGAYRVGWSMTRRRSEDHDHGIRLHQDGIEQDPGGS